MTPSPRDAAKFAVVVVSAACATTVDNADPVPRSDATAWTTIAAGDAAPSAATTVPVPSPATVASTTSSSSPLAPPTIPSGATTTIPPELNPCPPRGRSHFVVRPPVAWSIPDIPSDWRLQSIGTSVQGRDILAADPPGGDRRATQGDGHRVDPRQRGHQCADPAQHGERRDSRRCRAVADSRCEPGRHRDRNAMQCERCRPEPQLRLELESGGGRTGADVRTGDEGARGPRDRRVPDLVVWVHQPLRYVAAIGPTDPVHARAWARASDLPFRDDISQRGGGESWTAFVAGRPSVLLEVQFRDLSDRLVDLHVDGLSAALASFP